MEKTPISILQEYMQKKSKTPLYVYMGNEGGLFKYKVEAENLSAIGCGRTKKGAQQNSAQLLYEKIVTDISYNLANLPRPLQSAAAQIEQREECENSIAALQELCARRGLNLPIYEEVSESGPPHLRRFTIQCTLGNIKFTGEGPTKKFAKQQAARKLLEHYNDNVPISNIPILSCTNISKLNVQASAKYSELSAKWKSENINNYNVANLHFGLIHSIEEEMCRKALSLLSKDNGNAIDAIEGVFRLMSLDFEWSRVRSVPTVKMMSLQVFKATPPICIISSGFSEYDAKINAAKEAIYHTNILLSL